MGLLYLLYLYCTEIHKVSITKTNMFLLYRKYSICNVGIRTITNTLKEEHNIISNAVVRRGWGGEEASHCPQFEPQKEIPNTRECKPTKGLTVLLFYVKNKENSIMFSVRTLLTLLNVV